MTGTWLLLPGAAETPDDFAPLLRRMAGRLTVADPRTSPLRALVPPGCRLLAGHSLGGLAALRVALTRGDLHRLVLVDTTPPRDAGRVSPLLGQLLASPPARAAARAWWSPAVRAGERVMSVEHRPPPARARDDGYGPTRAYRQFRDGHDDAVAVNRLLTAGAGLPRVTLVVGTHGTDRSGRQRRWVGEQRALASRLRAHADAVELVTLPASGHLVHLDAPDELAAVLAGVR